MRTQEQMASIVTRQMKDLQLGLARKWGIPAEVLAGATFGLGVTMMFETGCTEEQIVDEVRRLVGNLGAPPDQRGAS
jgi:formate/nitrite transporter FocA (FNT family)